MTDPAPAATPPQSGRFILLPAALDPARDGHGMTIAKGLPARDGATAVLPDLTYVFIVFTNRSGSTYLGDLLAATGYFNRAGEPLNGDTVVQQSRARGLDGFAAYFGAIAAERAQNGHFVLKAAIGQVAVLAGHGILGRILPRSRFIVIQRADKLGQAISWSIASATGKFSSLQDRPPARVPEYSRKGLTQIIASYSDAEARASEFFGLNGIVPLHLTYELITKYRSLTVRLVCDFLGADAPDYDPARIRLQRQADALNDAWRARYLAGQ